MNIRISKTGIIFLAAILGIVWLFVPQNVQAENTRYPDILFLSSYDYSWDSIPKQLDGINDTLSGRAKIDYVFMDTKQYTYEEVKQRVYDEIHTHIKAQGTYDYVLAGDDAALNFVLEYRSEFFEGVPVVFEGINTEKRAYQVAEGPLITGVVEIFPMEKTIQMALSVNTKAKKIVGISDDTISGRGSSQQLLDCQNRFPGMEFEILDCSALTYEEIGTQMAGYGEDTILLFLMMSEDVNGNRYTLAEAAEYLTSRAKVPIYKSDENGIGQGFLGGAVVSYHDMAANGAEMILQMMSGTDASDIPVKITSSYCLFDKKVMDTFGIKKSDLEGEVTYVNDTPNFFKVHRVLLVPMSVVIIALFTITVVIYYGSRRRKCLMEEMQEKDLMLDSLLANIPGGVAIYKVKDDRVKTIYTSEGVPKLTGRTMDEYDNWIRGGLFEVVIDQEDAKRVFQVVRKNTSQGKPVNVKFRVPHKDGSLVWLALSAVFIRMEGTYRIYYTVLSDISIQVRSEQRELEARKAEEANKAKTDFLATVSHDMRTPLNGILGLTHLMLGKVEDVDLKKDLQQLDNSGRYLLNLINDTLDVSKIENGKLMLYPAVYDGKSTIRSIISLMEPNLKEKNIQFVSHIGELPYTKIYIDVGRVEQVALNIVGNAIKFSEVGGRIDFYLENISKEEGLILDRITVKDYGIGMSEEFLPHFFEPFTRENLGNKTKYKGTGLGMTISKQIVELMGGEISVESGLGKGTTVTFTLPMPIATEEQIKEWEQTQKENQKMIELTGRRALLCEDHPLNAMIVKRMLEGKGMEIEHAENGKIGVQMFMKSKKDYYDVVLMDVRMPEMDGLEAAEAIRVSHHPQAKSIPIIAMTANAFDEDVKRSFAAGMNAHLAKPVEPQKLYETLSECIRGKMSDYVN